MKKRVKIRKKRAKKVVLSPYIHRLTDDWGGDQDDALNPRL